MRPIQYLLALLLVPGVMLYARSLHSRLLDRLLVAAIGIAGLALVVWPNASQQLAEMAGVGRGVDFVMYVALLGLGYLFLLLFAKQRETEVRLTRLARELAIAEARRPNGAAG